ncbi:MAG: hypothetical protein HY077_05875 [Elusimicrobia bacterium]|nr:hypothetical protein [Elusimicrobiota bacterium]
MELAKSTMVLVDATPPTAVFLSPSANAGGVCSVVSGKFPIIGTVADLHFQGYVLDFAPGANATFGFTLIAASTVAVSSGTLGVWDTTALSGFQTLRLIATDLVDNVTVTTVTVFVGSPALLLSLQSRHGFNKPSGVAVDAGNRIYVADTNNDQVDVFTSTGGFVAILGRGNGQDDDKDDRTQGRLRLNKPKDVKVDAAGNVFIADTNNNRVVKVTLSGQLLLQIGRQHGKEHKDHDDDEDKQEEGQHGQGNGQFNKPSGVALDASGRIYVSDTNNHRVQVFALDGSFFSTFNLPAVARPEPNDDDDSNDPDSTALGQPFGIALDGSGNIYVADAHGDRALKFSPQGVLLASFGTSGSGTGQFKRPEGVAVSPDGGCLFVSDRNNNRIQRLDTFGSVTLVFGSGAAFNEPIGLALDSSGNLFVADRNNNRVEKFGAPTAVPSPPVIVDVGSVISGMVHARGGGKLERGDRVKVDVPDGALSQDMPLSIEPENRQDPAAELAKGQKLSVRRKVSISSGVDYGPHGLVFNKPVTITLAYNPGDLRPGQDPDALVVHYWNPQTSDWEAMPSVVNTSSMTVSAQTTHFSLFRILGSLPDPTAKAASDLSMVLMACNPLRPAIGCEPMRFKNLPAGASLRIFTFAGALVKNISADGTGQAAWDGTNQSGSPVASGVYFVYFQGAGQSKVLKVAVQR